MDVYGYEIDVKNASFKQEVPVIIRKRVEAKENESFPVYYYMNNLTGEYSLCEADLIKTPHLGKEESYFGKDIRYDIQYDEVANCIVFFKLRLDISHIELGVPRLYEEMMRFYVTPKKEIIFSYKTITETTAWKKIDHLQKIADLPFDFTTMDELYRGNKGEICKDILNCMSKVFCPVVTTAGNNAFTLSTPNYVLEFLMYKEPIVRKGPLQKKIDEYGEYELPNYIPKKDIEQKARFVKEGRLVKMPNNTLCLQVFNVMQDRETCYESTRLYFETDGTIIKCKKNNFNNFVPITSKLNGTHWTFRIFDYDEDVVEGTKLAYYKTIIKDIPIADRGYAVWCFINYGIFEKMYKMGFKNLLNSLFALAPSEPLASLESFFNVRSWKFLLEKNIHQSLGVNKYQLKRYIDFTNGNTDNCVRECFFDNAKKKLKIIKDIIAPTDTPYHYVGYYEDLDISDVDNETFDKIFNFVSEVSIPQLSLEAMRVIFFEYGRKALFDSFPIVKAIAESRFSRHDRLLFDYVEMVTKMNMTSVYKVKFSSLEELEALHDDVTELYNLKKNCIKTEQFAEAIKRVTHLEYEDENYAIVIPSCPDDLAKEGTELHHCVKSYIQRIINGTTNIVFLRKAEELDKPFFTIEVSNNGQIEQIHGLCNRNMDTEPDMMYFVNDWIKAKKLKQHNCNKVR